MVLHSVPILANGLRTDHPVPGLPFVDDEHLPLQDPDAIEAIGRHSDTGTWGRTDPAPDGGWVAFTTDPHRTDLAWVARWHPLHGRSVMLVLDQYASDVYTSYTTLPEGLLARSGGYWWDGKGWYRPAQIIDWTTERYAHRPVPSAVTVTAADLLAAGNGGPGARALRVGEVDPATLTGAWPADLVVWAAARPEDGLPLEECVVKVSAPELAGDELIGTPEMAAMAGIAASTLRSYIARDENDVPPTQAYINGRPAWARPVAAEWVEKRSQDSDSIDAALSATDPTSGTDHPIGVTALWARYSDAFTTRLWERPALRKRWALRYRTKQNAAEVAHDLAWLVAGDLRHIVPLQRLADTLRYAIVYDLHRGHELSARTSPGEPVPDVLGLVPAITGLLDWLIRHDPGLAAATIHGITTQAHQDHGIPATTVQKTLQTELSLRSDLPHEARADFLKRLFPTEA